MKTVPGVTEYYECSPNVWQSDDSALVSSETPTYLPSFTGGEACLLLPGQVLPFELCWTSSNCNGDCKLCVFHAVVMIYQVTWWL